MPSGSAVVVGYEASSNQNSAQEAARRVPCKALPKCDADALEVQACELFNKNKYEDALDAYDAAYKCRPAMKLLQAAFVVACNMRLSSRHAPTGDSSRGRCRSSHSACACATASPRKP